jgi:hypothetical protein
MTYVVLSLNAIKKQAVAVHITASDVLVVLD